MNPMLITAGLNLLQYLIKEAPHLKADIVLLLNKDNATEADWQALHGRIAAKSYEQLVPHSGLIPTGGDVPKLEGELGGEKY